MNWTLVCIVVGTALALAGFILWQVRRAERRQRQQDEADKSPSMLEIALREAQPPVKDEEAQQADQLAGLHKAIKRECHDLPARLQIEGEVWQEGKRCVFQLKGARQPVSLAPECVRLTVGLGGPPRFSAVEYRSRPNQLCDKLKTGLSLLVGSTPWLAVLYLDLFFTIGMNSMPEKRGTAVPDTGRLLRLDAANDS